MPPSNGPASAQRHAPPNSRFGDTTDSASNEPPEYEHGSVATLPVTGERLVPGIVGQHLFRQHEARYVFAGTFVRKKRVLDVASGSGIGTQYLLDAGAQDCIGLDIDRGATQYARAAYPDCIFTQCEATRLCLAEASIDVVVSFETIEHVKDQQTFLMECERVLRPGGIFVCSTPNRTLARWGEDNPFHFQELTVAQFRHLVAAVFNDVQLYAQNSSVYPLYVGKTVVSRVLNKLKLTDPIRRVVASKGSSSFRATKFSAGSEGLVKEIQPLRTRLLRQPMFVIAVARKALT
jgi:ubiquinone/menaquinone biosynthesis C-methylase UbiE